MFFFRLQLLSSLEIIFQDSIENTEYGACSFVFVIVLQKTVDNSRNHIRPKLDPVVHFFELMLPVAQTLRLSADCQLITSGVSENTVPQILC